MRTTSIMAILLFLSVSAPSVWSASPDTASFVGKVFPPEKRTWQDDSTGYEITQWTSVGENNHPYFTVESFIDPETAIIFSKRTGGRQLYKLSLTSGAMTQLTVARKLGGIDHLPRFKTVWYMDGTHLKSLRTDNLQSREVYDFGWHPFHVGSFSVSCDGKWFIFAVNKKDVTEGNCGYGPYAIYRLSLVDTSLSQVTMDYGFNIGHVQANPVDPSLIMYCWQWSKPGAANMLVGHAPTRIWWVNIDGTEGGSIPQEYGTQRTHETWTTDGKAIAFVSKYRIGPKKGQHFLGVQSIDGSVNDRYYEQVSPAHQNLFKDSTHWIVDQYNNLEPLLVLFKRGQGKMDETRILFRHGSSMEGQGSHPHPRFSPTGKYVLFSTDKTGSPQVYTVRIDLDKKR